MTEIDKAMVLIMFGLTWSALAPSDSWKSWAGVGAGAAGLVWVAIHAA